MGVNGHGSSDPQSRWLKRTDGQGEPLGVFNIIRPQGDGTVRDIADIIDGTSKTVIIGERAWLVSDATANAALALIMWDDSQARERWA